MANKRSANDDIAIMGDQEPSSSSTSNSQPPIRKRKRFTNTGSDVICKHTIVIKDLCAECGKDLRSVSGGLKDIAANISMIHHVPELVVTSELADKFGHRDKTNLLKSRKLVLLCDLDQTLIHSSGIWLNIIYMVANQRNIDRQPKPNEESPEISQFEIDSTRFYTKLRPHTQKFLEKMSKIYEMSIVTYGHRIYAHSIARILDPTETYFGQRIISRNELLDSDNKTRNIKFIFPKSEDLIVMIDDRPDVWLHSDALICVKPYKYFTGVGDINEPSSSKREKNEGSQKINGDGSERDYLAIDNDNTLEYLEKILCNIHSCFYQYFDKEQKIQNVKSIINWLRSQVLLGEYIALSGMIPLDADFKSSLLYRMCHQFGAVIEEIITDKTTVLIAARQGTEKVRTAKKRGVPVVSHRWLSSCLERWQKVNKDDFLLECDEMPVKSSPLSAGDALSEQSNALGVKSISSMDVISHQMLKDMDQEVNEFLSGSDDNGDSDDSASNEQGTGSIKESMLDVSPLLDDTDSNIPAVSRETSKTESEFDSESASSRSNKTESDEDFDDMVKNMEEQLYDGGDEND